MRVREATHGDQARIIEMATRFLAESAYGRMFPADPARLGVLMTMCVQMGVIFVAETEAGIVGMIALVSLTDPIGGVNYADEIAWWVEPAHRGGMVGPRLVARAQNWVRVKGLAFLKMVAPADRPDVGAFYQRIGFEAVETAYIKRF
jgi:GNAT superfamily N-acetyltransferase